MLHPDIAKLLNEQINKEFYSPTFIWRSPTTTRTIT
jgi:ferritin